MLRSISYLLLAGFVALPANAQLTAPTSPVDSFAIRALHWRLIGPFRSGRSVAAAGSVKRPLEYYSGTTGGGVMKTTDGGYTWKPVTDKYFGGTIGGIAVYPANPDIVYVGTGEYTLRGNASHGDGVFKTTDGGTKWDTLGLAETRQISRVIVHPSNPDIVYVAALGHESGPNPERGIFKSTDGGKTWKKTLFVNDSVGATDLQMDPADPNVLYAAMWRVQRKPFDLISGGAGSGIFKSTDGGDKWTEITRNPGLPRGIIGNVGLDVSPANHQLVWAMIESDSVRGGLFRSNDAGATWTRVNDSNSRSLDGIAPHWRPFYFSKVTADPVDTNTVYLPNGVLYRSTDGGKHFKEVQGYNDLWDTHQLWIAPNDANRMIIAADQGARVSFNKGESWSTTGYATGQFYHVIATNHFPYRVCGAQQDNSGACGPSRTDGMFDISAWYYPGGGESGIIAVDPKNPDLTYATGERVDHGTGTSNRMIESAERVAPPMTAKYRFNWTTPIIVSPHNRNTLYQGGNVLFRSVDGGRNWRPISPDLTRHDPSTLVISGGRSLTIENSGAENFATIFTIAESPVAKGVIWVGSDDGMIHLTRDGGLHWTDVTPKGLPPFTRMSIIDASPFAAGTVYLAANRQLFDDYKPYLFKSTDFGATWTEIDAGLPQNEFTRVVREDPVRRGLLFAGTERGVWFSLDDGGHWQSLRRNLPQVPVHDLIIKDGDLAIATHGRALWIMDDISPLRQLSASTMSGKARLFDPVDTYRVSWRGQQLIQNLPKGEDPGNGAAIYYWLADSNQVVTLDVRSASGTLVNHFSSVQDSIGRADSLRLDHLKQLRNDSLKKAGVTDTATLNKPFVEPTDEPTNRLSSPPRLPAKKGLNVFYWNFRYADGTTLRDTVYRLTRVRGPLVAPGRYSVELTSGGSTQRASFTLKADPRTQSTGAELAARLAFTRRLNAAATEIVDAVNRSFALRQEIDRRLAADSTSSEAASLKALRDTLLVWGKRLVPQFYRRNQSAEPYTATIFDELQRLGFGDSDAGPNAVELSGAESVTALAHAEVIRFNAAVGAQVAALNAALRAKGQPTLNF